MAARNFYLRAVLTFATKRDMQPSRENIGFIERSWWPDQTLVGTLASRRFSTQHGNGSEPCYYRVKHLAPG